MEEFTTRTYGTSGLDNRPLFGETSARDRIINLVVGSLTSLLVVVTLISAFVFPQLPPKPVNIFFAVCISLSTITACVLVSMTLSGHWNHVFSMKPSPGCSTWAREKGGNLSFVITVSSLWAGNLSVNSAILLQGTLPST
uniref:Transmembrane protein 243 n=1 Tax=Ornithorhynchus anatinus TaxID=9258 RepID=A0A6I8N903_ORNAN